MRPRLGRFASSRTVLRLGERYKLASLRAPDAPSTHPAI